MVLQVKRCTFVLILCLTEVRSSQLLSKQAEIGKPADLIFRYSYQTGNDPSISCLKEPGGEVFTRSPTGAFHESWSNRGLSFSFTKAPSILKIHIPSTVAQDDGLYTCTATGDTAEHLRANLVTYSNIGVNSSYHLYPPANENGSIPLNMGQQVLVTSDAGCNKPEVNLTLYWNNKKVKMSTSEPCAAHGYRKTILEWQAMVQGDTKLIISVSHPAVQGGHRNVTYNVITKGTCDQNPCANGGTCVENIAFLNKYTCTCARGYIGEHCEQQTSGSSLSRGHLIIITVVCIVCILLVILIVVVIDYNCCYDENDKNLRKYLKNRGEKIRKKKKKADNKDSSVEDEAQKRKTPTAPEDTEAGVGDKETDEMLRKKQANNDNKDFSVEDEAQNNIKNDEVKADAKAGGVKTTQSKDETS